jgi:zinc transporter 1/2/3
MVLPTQVFAGIFLMVVVENLWYYIASRKAATTTPDAKAALADDFSDDYVAVMKVSPTEHGPAPAITAYMFELGCVTHSFIIGLALGVTADRSQVVTLTIGLVFHQLLEAIGLGTVIIRANFSSLKSIVMLTTYSLTVPLGIAIGMGVATSYDGESMGALTAQGILNSISGGLLLYIALVQMIAQDFAHMTGGLLVRLGMYFMLALGGVSMILIAMYGEGDATGHGH